jgi:hypothetical protein
VPKKDLPTKDEIPAEDIPKVVRRSRGPKAAAPAP